MADGDMEGHDVVVKNHLIGGCRVQVLKNMEEGVFRVVRPKTDEVLAVFSFNVSDRNNMSRGEAEQRAEEYAHGYVSGYNDGLEN